MSDHSHPEIDDRITAEIALVRTEIAGVNARVDVVRQDVSVLRQDVAAMRNDMRRGFTDVSQVMGQILARLPDETRD